MQPKKGCGILYVFGSGIVEILTFVNCVMQQESSSTFSIMLPFFSRSKQLWIISRDVSSCASDAAKVD